MCIPEISRTDLYDIALVAGIKMIIRQMEGYNDEKPLSTDLVVQVTNMASTYFLAGKNVRFILEMLFLACAINKPRPGEKPEYDVQGADPEKSFVCLMQGEVDQCYSYHYNPEEDIYLEPDEKDKKTDSENPTDEKKPESPPSPTDEKKPESPANATVAQRSAMARRNRARFRSIAGSHHKKRFRF